MRHRLYHRIFATLTLFVVLALVLASIAGHLLLSDVFRTHMGAHLASMAAAIERRLAAAPAVPGELQRLSSAPRRS